MTQMPLIYIYILKIANDLQQQPWFLSPNVVRGRSAGGAYGACSRSRVEDFKRHVRVHHATSFEAKISP